MLFPPITTPNSPFIFIISLDFRLHNYNFWVLETIHIIIHGKSRTKDSSSTTTILHPVFHLFLISISTNIFLVNPLKLFIKLISILLYPLPFHHIRERPYTATYINIPVSNNLLILRHRMISCIQIFFHNATSKLQLPLNLLFPASTRPVLPHAISNEPHYSTW